MTAAKEVKTTAAVFELPQKLGILQYVEYEPPRGWCTDRCLYEGVLTGACELTRRRPARRIGGQEIPAGVGLRSLAAH
jgi:hypothetical protein